MWIPSRDSSCFKFWSNGPQSVARRRVSLGSRLILILVANVTTGESSLKKFSLSISPNHREYRCWCTCQIGTSLSSRPSVQVTSLSSLFHATTTPRNELGRDSSIRTSTHPSTEIPGRKLTIRLFSVRPCNCPGSRFEAPVISTFSMLPIIARP